MLDVPPRMRQSCAVKHEHLYIREAIDQIDAAFRASAWLQLHAQQGNDDELWDSIEHVLSASVRVANIFWSTRSGAPKRRARALRQSLGLKDENFGYLREVRNSFEHIDERLDQWAEEAGDAIMDRGIGRGNLDVVVLHPDGTADHSRTARSYAVDYAEVRVFGKEVSFRVLMDEFVPLRERLQGALDTHYREEAAHLEADRDDDDLTAH